MSNPPVLGRYRLRMPSDRRFVFRPLTGLILVAVLLCVVIAVVYLTTAAGDLPSFFPGQTPHSIHKHTKHGLAFLALAAAGVVAAWFTTAPPNARRSPSA